MRAIPRSLDDASSPFGDHVLVRAAARALGNDESLLAWRRQAAWLETQLVAVAAATDVNQVDGEQGLRAIARRLAEIGATFSDTEIMGWYAPTLAALNGHGRRLLGETW
jgi:hypothetical protein